MKQKRDSSKPRKPGPKKSGSSRSKKLDTEDDNSQEVPDSGLRTEDNYKETDNKNEFIDLKGQVVPSQNFYG